jgi:putative peptidoglycan lipid II flippase
MPSRTDGRHALLVAAGIFLSRIIGLVRQRAISHFLGTSAAAGVVQIAFRAPNVLQNLLGEGVLSASFIPVYARLLADGDEREAGRVAGAVGALLALAVTLFVLLGVLAAPLIVSVLTPTFTGETRALAIELLRITFPATALFVMSAWCLGILNSHHRFFLSYASPVAWSAAIIVALLAFASGRGDADVGRIIAWSSLAGAALQLLVQLPVVLRLERRLPLRPDWRAPHVRTVLANVAPVVGGRGVVQISAYVDQFLAGLISASALAVLGTAQTIALLPVSLFGMAVSASELPAMARERGDEATVFAALRERLGRGLRRIAFLVVPSAVALLALGDVVTGLLFQSGRFTAGDSRWVWGALAALAVGLVPGTAGRLYSSALYALRDTRTPLRCAAVRVALGIALSALLAFPVRAALGIDMRWAVAGVALGGALASWVEFAMLRGAVRARVGAETGRGILFGRLSMAALLAAAAAWGARLALPVSSRPVLAGFAVLGTFAAVYGLATLAARVPEAEALLARLRRRTSA